MEIKEATEVAAKYLINFFPRADAIKLEEVEITDDDKYWNITLSYVDLEDNFGYVLGSRKQAYKIFKIDTEKGNVRSMKIRDIR